jgi:hypothetical protein
MFGDVNFEGKNHLGQRGSHWKIILTWIVEKWDVRLSTRLMWLKIDFNREYYRVVGVDLIEMPRDRIR